MNANQKRVVGGFGSYRFGLWALLAMLVPAALGPIGCMAPAAGPRKVVVPTAGDAVRVWSEPLTLPTYAVQPDPVPRFQVTDDKKYYPYTSQENIAPQAAPRTWTAVCLENRYLKVTVMPELGGRVFAIYDKIAGRDVIYRQRSIKPGRVGIRGAWICGGIEYDFPDSHSVTTHDKVHWTTREYPDGSASILVGDVRTDQPNGLDGGGPAYAGYRMHAGPHLPAQPHADAAAVLLLDQRRRRGGREDADDVAVSQGNGALRRGLPGLAHPRRGGLELVLEISGRDQHVRHRRAGVVHRRV